MAQKTTATLVCASCSHANEPERVYCHNCGEKLDRSILPQSEDVTKPGADIRRVKKMMNPSTFSVAVEMRTLAKVLTFSAILSAVVLYWLPPDVVPLIEKDVIEQRNLGDDWGRMMAAKQALVVPFSETDVNHFLQKTLKASDSMVPGVKFERAFVGFIPGAYTLTVQRDAWGLAMYSSVTYRPVVKDGGVSAEVIAAHYGRLGIPPALSAIVDFAVGGVVKTFEKEMKQVGRLADVKVVQSNITLTTKP